MSCVWLILFLVCLIFQKKLNSVEAKQGFGPGEQDWGHVQVRPGGYMFWWLYYVNPPTKSADFDVFKKPLLIWLQGGPGESSTGFGNFKEFGPLDENLQRRNHTGIHEYNILFVDNPLGTGFSYVEDNSLYVMNNQQIVEDLMKCVQGFFDKIPRFQNVTTYIYGESYGGKIASALALTWDKFQKNGEIRSNLQGLLLADPWISPLDSTLSYASFLYNMGTVNTNGYEQLKRSAESIKNQINSQDWTAAYFSFIRFYHEILKLTNNIDFLNILDKQIPTDNQPSQKYFSGYRNPWNFSDNQTDLSDIFNNQIKEALGLNVDHIFDSIYISLVLCDDFMRPVVDNVELLLNETSLKIFVINGQLDPIVPTVSTLAWMEQLKWSGSENWKKSERFSLVVDDVAEGFIQEYEKLTLFLVYRAGHRVVKDNPYAFSVILRLLTST